MDRSRNIIRVSFIGIAANVVLAAFKAVVGIITGSIAIVLDAVNNLSDAFSSIVTIVGTKIASKPPDKKHPYGHGRVEYISAIVIAIIVILAGVTAFREAVSSILHPEAANYTVASLLIIAAAVLVKFFLGRYVKHAGETYRSESLVASGTDASFDALVSLSTLVAALVSMIFHISIEGWLGVVIAVLIIKAGAEILLDSLSSIIGARVEGETTTALREKINSYPDVKGTYDLILNRYGPERTIGSVHIEVPDQMTAREIHHLTRKMAEDVYNEFGIVLTVGIYAANDSDPAYEAIRKEVEETVARHEGVLGIHGFYVDPSAERVTFDLLMEFGADWQKVYQEVKEDLSAAHPEYRFDIVLDSDISD